ncbi:AbrB/MazE/SpoVT family DNA-binding domain-containing protein [Alteribacillus sp. HJP-4]|uniref:AbrB/MazE/SpoVT family DNA-binding domain-containing protein n=1 Tax=Alteribacillus sp. HJP-4 TaxID=2775394 RepID=UPI0035CCDF0F
MKSTGMVRKVDELGRVVLPKELRNILDLQYKTPTEIYVDGDQIILKKYTPDKACAVTGIVSSNNFTTTAGDINLSPDGAKKLMKQLEEYVDERSRYE